MPLVSPLMPVPQLQLLVENIIRWWNLWYEIIEELNATDHDLLRYLRATDAMLTYSSVSTAGRYLSLTDGRRWNAGRAPDKNVIKLAIQRNLLIGTREQRGTGALDLRV